MLPRLLALAVVALVHACMLAAPLRRWVVSANEGKLDLVTGAQRMLPNPPPDSVTLLDFAHFPPHVRHLTNIPNTVLGPPSNVALSPDHRHVVIANSILADPSRTNGWRPARDIHVLDLASEPPALTTFAVAGLQPSGICFSRSGRHLVVANRADGSV